jgi:hypothetical protein
MRRSLLSTTGLFALALAIPRVAQAQAEEAPPSVVDNAPLPVPLQARTVPMSTPTTPVVAPSPHATSSATLEHDHGRVFLPYLGLNLPVADTAKSYSAGFRLGGLAGWHVTPWISINAEFALDLMDGDPDASMLKPHEHYLDFVLSPLLHLQFGRIVVGPRLGWFTNNRSYSDSDSASRQCMSATGSRSDCSEPSLEAHNGQGLLFGLNAGGFVPFGRMTIGMLASASFRHFMTVDCGPYGCGGDYRLVTVVNLSLAAML